MAKKKAAAVPVVPDNKPEAGGIRCPKCGCQVSRVYYTRNRNGAARRARICGSPICGNVYSTTERVTGGR